jgi:hypothetical protein
MSGEDDAGGEESRSDRLRRRRSQRQESGAERGSSEIASGDAESDAPASGSNTSDPSDRSKPSEQDETAERDGVKSEQVGTYMYLPKGQKKDVERLYNVLKAEYEYEYDDENFEKNRHFYPLVVQYGLEGLDGLDASDIRERLDHL